MQITIHTFFRQESNFTTYGSGKDLLFLDRFKGGWLREHQTKMVYVVLPFFKEKGKENGWYADAYIRLYISKMVSCNYKTKLLQVLLSAGACCTVW